MQLAVCSDQDGEQAVVLNMRSCVDFVTGQEKFEEAQGVIGQGD
jgi:hypothetical protein